MNLKILYISDSYFDLYGIDARPVPAHYIEMIQNRLRAGWLSISEVFSDKSPSDYANDRVINNEYFRDFHISREGAVLDVTHCVDRNRKIIAFDFIPTNARIPAKPEMPAQTRALMAVRDLSMFSMFSAFPSIYVFKRFSGSKQAYVVACPRSGRVLFVDAGGSFPELSHVQFFSDIALDTSAVVSAIENDGFYLGSFDLLPGKRLSVELTIEKFYVDGPGIILRRVTKDHDNLSVEMIRDNFSGLTKKEAEVIYLVAQGYSLKECAGLTGKAQATVTLQARHALKKTGERSIRHLLAKIYQL